MSEVFTCYVVLLSSRYNITSEVSSMRTTPIKLLKPIVLIKNYKEAFMFLRIEGDIDEDTSMTMIIFFDPVVASIYQGLELGLKFFTQVPFILSATFPGNALKNPLLVPI